MHWKLSCPCRQNGEPGVKIASRRAEEVLESDRMVVRYSLDLESERYDSADKIYRSKQKWQCPLQSLGVNIDNRTRISIKISAEYQVNWIGRLQPTRKNARLLKTTQITAETFLYQCDMGGRETLGEHHHNQREMTIETNFTIMPDRWIASANSYLTTRRVWVMHRTVVLGQRRVLAKNT